MAQEIETTPRAEHVGSLIRPQELVALRFGLLKGQGDPAALGPMVDRAVLAALRRQEEVGLDVVGDGEFRRFSFMGEVTSAVRGFAPGRMATPDWTRGEEDGSGETDNPGTFAMVVTDTLMLEHPIAGREDDFLLEHAKKPFKITLPSPLVIAQSCYSAEASARAYPSRGDFLWAVAEILREEVNRLAAAGVPYIQIDNPGLAYFLDPELRERSHALGIQMDFDLEEAVAADNHCLIDLDQKPGARPLVGFHVCRGNWRSAWMAKGGYESLAERIFSMRRVDRFLLEYDTPRAGGFEPLAVVPDPKVAVLGLVTSKEGRLEDEDDLVRRIEEDAAAHIPLDRLAVSPQCGFATSIPGNLLSEEEQWAKLALVKAVARRVWG